MIENLKINSQLGPVTGSAKINRTGDRDGGREKKKFEEALGGEEDRGEGLRKDEGPVQEVFSRDISEEEGGLGRVVNIRV